MISNGIELIASLDGKLLPAGKAAVPISSQGFLYGASLFETLRVYDGRLFRLAAHLERMLNSADALGFGSPSRETITQAVSQVIAANRIKDSRLRITWFRGESPGEYHLLVTAVPGVPYTQEQRQTGLRAQVSSFRIDSHSQLVSHKTGNYLPNLLAREHAREAGFDEALLLNDEGFLAEGSASNLFLVHQGKLVTPDLESGILPGITRQTVLMLAEKTGIGVEERRVRLQELQIAEEAFLTNSLMEVMPLVQVDDWKTGDGKPGGITLELIRGYQQEIQQIGFRV